MKQVFLIVIVAMIVSVFGMSLLSLFGFNTSRTGVDSANHKLPPTGLDRTTTPENVFEKECVFKDEVWSGVVIPVPELPQNIEWKEVTDMDILSDYQSQALHVSPYSTPQPVVPGGAWTTTYRSNGNLQDTSEVERVFREYFLSFFTKNDWSYNVYLRGFEVAGIQADHPTGAAESIGYVQEKDGWLRTVTLSIRRTFVRDEASDYGDYSGDILGASDVSLSVFISEPVRLTDILPGYTPGTFLGIFYGMATSTDSKRKAVIISEVLPHSPAEKAGLLDGDQILTIDGNLVTDETKISKIIGHYCPGDVVEIHIRRDEQRIILAVTLGEY